jgi:DNA modification methylase
MTELEEDISWFASQFVNKVHQGDCLDILKTLPDNCIDAIVSDPPYGLGTKEPTGEDIDRYLSGESRLDTGGDFMGHSWDIPSVAVFKECYRVLKPGRHVLCFAGTRTWDLMAAGMRAAGFTPQGGIAEKFGLPLLQWIHGQGFPKSLDIAKAIDKHLGVKREVLGERTVVQGGGTSLELRMGEKREVQVQVTAPTSPEAKKWEGWGTALKPAWEPVIAFIKPGPAAGFKPPDFPFRYVSKITASEADAGLDPNAYLEGTRIAKNCHPTRKPLKIMDWLIGLVSAPGEVVLDPFCGSGTTCVSAVWLGRQWAGCELDPKFHAIACERVRVASEQTSAIQRGHFDAAIDLADRPDDESLPPMQLEVLTATTIPAPEALPTMPSPPPAPERNSLFDLAMDDD